MEYTIGPENPEAQAQLESGPSDTSGIGVNYVDAYLKPLNAVIPGGPSVACKRKGLTIVLTVGNRAGQALLRRFEHGPDPVHILRHALEEAAADAGVRLGVTKGEIRIETGD
jgi:hypothetical protein